MTTHIPILETDRLRIRPYQMGDLDALHGSLVDAGWVDSNLSHEESRAKQKKHLQWAIMNTDALANLYQPPYGDRAVVSKETDEFIGSVGLVPTLKPYGLLPYYQEHYPVRDPQQRLPEMGMFWIVSTAHQGKGYATESAQAMITHMFEIFNLQRIIATTDYDNLASQQVMRKLGMTLDKNPYDDPPWFQVVGILENNNKGN